MDPGHKISGHEQIRNSKHFTIWWVFRGLQEWLSCLSLEEQGVYHMNNGNVWLFCWPTLKKRTRTWHKTWIFLPFFNISVSTNYISFWNYISLHYICLFFILCKDTCSDFLAMQDTEWKIFNLTICAIIIAFWNKHLLKFLASLFLGVLPLSHTSGNI